MVTTRVALLYIALGTLRVVDCVVAMLLAFPLWLYPESEWPWRLLFGFDHAIEEVRADLVKARKEAAKIWGPRQVWNAAANCVGVAHTLKTWPEYFEDVENDSKPFELRKDDRPWRVGDDVVLAEWDPRLGLFTGRTATRKIVYILHASDCKVGGLEPGYCILGLRRLP